MNLADIEKTFWGDQREQPTRVRLARVIRALRDEVRVIHVDQFSMEKLFDEILAGAGEEKAAGDVNPDGARISGLETTAPAASGSPAADCCKICGGSGSTPATLICPGCDGSGEEVPCVWVDEMPSHGKGYGYLRQWRNSTCGRPEWGVTDYTEESLRQPLRCQCGRLIEIAGEIHFGRMLPEVEGHTT